MEDSTIHIDKLKFDENLGVFALNDENWQKLIPAEMKTKKTFEEKIKMPPFPEFHTLAELSDIVYEKKTMSKASPEGWELFTCTRNKSNGYFGAVFINKNFNQIVISHRGTQINSWKDLWTDIKGIGLNKYVPQMNSAATFSHWIAQLFQKTNAHYQISITGHSLGGWLAQVTTFTLKYLTRREDHFEKINQQETGFHAHTVTFDNPGCRSMLMKLMDTFDLRTSSSIDIESLDISACLSCPNRVNTYDSQVGAIYRIYPDLKGLNLFQKKVLFTKKSHNMSNLAKSIRQEEGKEVKIKQVLDWPHCLSKEFKDFFKLINEKKFENYDPGDENEAINKYGISIRYQTRSLDKNCCSSTVFTTNEKEFLQNWKKLKKLNRFLGKMPDFANDSVLNIYYELTEKCDIDGKKIKCEQLEEVIKITKQIIAFYPKALGILLECLQEEKIIPIHSESLKYIKESEKLIKSEVQFQDVLGIAEFVTKDKVRLHIIAEDTAFETSRIRNILSRIDVIETSKTLFLAWKDVLHLQTNLDLVKILTSNSQLIDLMIIECPEVITDDGSIKLLYNSGLKKIIFVSKPADIEKMVALDLDRIDVTKKNIEFAQLDRETMGQLLETKFFNLAGQELTLRTFLGLHTTEIPNEEINRSISPQLMKDLVSKEFKVIRVNDEELNDHDLQVYFTDVNETVETKHLMDLLPSDNITADAAEQTRILFVTGVDNEIRNQEDRLIDILAAEDGEKQRVRKFIKSKNIVISVNEHEEQHFRKICLENFSHKIFWFHVKDQRVYCLKIFDRGLYIQRSFLFGIHNIDKSTIAKKIFDSSETFIFGNIKNKQRLAKVIDIKSADKDYFFNKTNVLVTEEDGAELFYKLEKNKIVHWLKLDQNELVWENSSGNLQTIRNLITSENEILMNELGFMKNIKKVAIISDKPGMGKSTILAKCFNRIPSSWIIRINFRNCGEALNLLPSEIDLKSAVKFLKQKQDLLQNERIAQLFEICLQYNTSIKVFLLFDAYDELSHETSNNFSQDILYNDVSEKALKLLKFFKQKTKAYICVTTREYTSRILEDTLSIFSTRFKEIEEPEQEQFLNFKWSACLETKGQLFNKEENERLSLYIKKIMKRKQEHFDDKILSLMGIPLQMAMIADIERPNLHILKSDTDQEDQQLKAQMQNMSSLYARFVDKKFDIFMKKKFIIYQAPAINTNDAYIKLHQELSLKHFFSQKAEHLMKTDITGSDKKSIQTRTELNQIGLVKVTENAECEFIHETFAEYFAASFFIDWVEQTIHLKESPQLPYWLLIEILAERKYREIRLFLNDFLNKTIPEFSLKFHGEQVGELFLQHHDKFYNVNQSESCLHIIVEEEHKKIFEFLINALELGLQANESELLASFINKKNLTRTTALELAAEQGDEDVCAALLRNKADVHAEEESPLHYAAWMGHKNICALLLQNKANVNAQVKYNLGRLNMLDPRYLRRESIPSSIAGFSTPLHLAACKGYVETCVFLLLNKAHVNMTNGFDEIPLHLAAKKGHKDVCTCLLEFGGDVNKKDIFKNTPLHNAAENGLEYVCDFLLNNEADVNAQNRSCMTPLHIAARAGHKDVCDVLLQYEAEVNAKDVGHAAPLHIAAFNGHRHVCAYLLQNGADVNAKDDCDMTSLHFAAEKGQKDVCDVLLQKEANVNANDLRGLAPLHLSAFNGHRHVCIILLRNEADVNAKNKHDMTPLHFAAYNDHKDVCKVLLRNKAHVNAKNDDNVTPLHIAAEMGSENICKFLIQNKAGRCALQECNACAALFVHIRKKRNSVKNFSKRIYFAKPKPISKKRRTAQCHKRFVRVE